MKTYNVALIGYGKMGKIYAKEINKRKEYKIIDILRQKNISENPRIVKKIFKSKKINLIIISSPINTHFKYLQLAYRLRNNIIIEKPLIENIHQLKKLIQLNKNYKKRVMIHHNDVLNFEKIKFMNSFKKLQKINKIEMYYGKKEITNSYKKPFFDWLPHPLSVVITFFGEPNKLKIIKYSKKIKKKIINEKLRLMLDFKNFPIYLNFSNNFNKPSKKIIVFGYKKRKVYDGYNKKNQRSIKLLLDKFFVSKKINDVSKNINTYKLLFKIEKLIQ